MAWIESHQALEKHPKVYDLMSFMGWDLDTTIGKLHRFWWWCVDYAEDGDLRKHNDARLGAAVGLNGEQAAQFVKAMVKACWLDQKPYFRVHEWWNYLGKFLQIKYKHHPEKWQRIKELYTEGENGSKGGSKKRSKTHNLTNLNQPKPNQQKETIPRAPVSEVPVRKREETATLSRGILVEQETAFKAFWEAVPDRNGKKLEQQETFRRFCLIPAEEWPLVIQAAKNYAASEQVRDGVGIKDPKNFLGNQVSERGFWREWIEGEKAPSDDDSVFGFLEKAKGAEL